MDTNISSYQKKDSNQLIRFVVITIFATLVSVFMFSLIKYFSDTNSYLYQLFFERSWIQYVTTFCFWIVIAILILRHKRFSQENRAYNTACQIIGNADIGSTFIWSDTDRIKKEFTDEKHKVFLDSLTFTRIINALDRLRKTESTRAFEEYFRTRSDIDDDELESSYAGARYFTWLIPTLGFIGTVMGIGTGIKGFADIISNADDFAKVKEFLPVVTSHLGTAFDTTLLALGLSAVAVFYMSFLLKREQQFLEQVNTLAFDGVCPLFREHSGASQEIVKAIGDNVDSIRKSMIGNRASIEAVVRKELPIILVEQLKNEVVKEWSEKFDNLAGQIEELKGIAKDYLDKLEDDPDVTRDTTS